VLVAVPEGQSSQIGRLNRAHDELTEQFGRPPSHSEIADHLGMPLAHVERIQKARMRDIPASSFESDPSSFASNFEDQQIAVAQNELPKLFPNKPELHELFHRIYGTGGYQATPSTGALAKHMGKSVSQVSRMKTQLGNSLRDHMGLDPLK
jgi:DNA-directed RNA polymerase specialized sigma subunit